MDKIVDISDLNAIIANWGKITPSIRGEVDYNGSAVFSNYDWNLIADKFLINIKDN